MGRELGVLELCMFVVGVLKAFDVEWASKDPQPEMKMYWLMEIYGLRIRFKATEAVSLIPKDKTGNDDI